MGEPEEIQVETEEQPPEGQQPKAGFSIGKLIEWLLSNLIPVIIAVVISTILAYILILSTKSKNQEEIYKTVALAPKPAPYQVFPMDDFRVNTADKDEPHFMRVKLGLAFDADNKKLSLELTERTPQIRDIIMSILNSKEKQDLDPESAKEGLKEEIKKEINNILTTGVIVDIYYDQFIIS
ncbi:MAG: flagellar basal body-associated FliL family protein [Brevinematales bacterium]|jgi:flagellar basal body-associated protein FliL